MRISAALLTALALSAHDAVAQTSSDPLSAIDWLSENAKPVAQSRAEPPVSRTAGTPDVSVVALGDSVRKRLGLLPFEVTQLKPNLWAGSDADRLARLLGQSVRQRLPAGQELLITLLLAEADDLPIAHQASAWTAARIEALSTLGAVDPALALVEQADPTSSPNIFARWLDLSLLAKSEITPCQALIASPALSTDKAVQIYCTARAGDVHTAILLFGTSAVLDTLSDTQEALLGRFLDPDLFEDDPMPRAPVRPDPLTFRLFEAAGATLPTAPLPRVFAHFDLSTDAGWKAQLEAAERLARAGTLPSNQLLGLYTERKAAASGGIWDRVRALQAFDAALQANDTGKIAQTLPAIWRGMKAAGLQTQFSELFAPRLTAADHAPDVQRIVFHMTLLSHAFKDAVLPNEANKTDKFLMSVAEGAANPTLTSTDISRAVADGFAAHAEVSNSVNDADDGQSGEALLQVLAKISDAGRGDAAALRQAISDLNALGLGDYARRTALQALILLDNG